VILKYITSYVNILGICDADIQVVGNGNLLPYRIHDGVGLNVIVYGIICDLYLSKIYGELDDI
jgi:hypothetical protein